MSGPEATHSEETHSELAALADGTLPDERRSQLLAQVAADPALATELERQHRALALMGTLERVTAPEVLRRSIESLATDGPSTGTTGARVRGARRVRSGRLRLQAAVALAVVAAVVVALALTGGGGPSTTAAPTLLQASRLALRPATGPGPAESTHDGSRLALSAAGIPYPYWGARPLRWQATGVRTDAVGGRLVTTVFYADRAGRTVGYSIVSGLALPVPAGSATVVRHGLVFHVVRPRGPAVVTWREAGHTCILTARAVGPRTLVRLAAWQRV